VNLEGILPPVATPFRDDGIDLPGLRANVQKWMRTGLRGLVVLGSNGEAPYVDEAEAVEVIAATREWVPRDRLLIAGTGKASTRQTIRASRDAARAGADAVLVLTPASFKPQMTGEALLHHYRAVADESPVPVLLYNFPAATGVTLAVETTRALCEHPNIVGVKESSGDLAVVGDLVATTPDRFQVVVGAAPTLFASLAVGANGGVVAVANVVPDLCVRLHALTRAGRHDEAVALQRALTPLARAVTTLYGVPGLKAAMELAGYVGGAPRSPLVPVPPDVRENLAGMLNALMTAA
jgi:4-hydroxy-2-oxoglutarate aldolase